MKVMNAIKSEFSGKILKICFRDGEDVYDDDVLFIIKK
jgi:biotin carboxyl carrier protein